MELGRNSARIIDYGLSKTKLGSAQVFIKLLVEQTGGSKEVTWYGVPFKKDGEVNEFMMAQLAYCGFDPSVNSIEDLSNGIDSGILISNENIDVYVRDETSPSGEIVRKINTLGPMGPMRIATEEAKALISGEQASKIKALASKFKPRKPGVAIKPADLQINGKESDDIPF